MDEATETTQKPRDLKELLPEQGRLQELFPYASETLVVETIRSALLLNDRFDELPDAILRAEILNFVEMLEGLRAEDAQLPFLDVQIAAAHRLALNAANRLTETQHPATRQAEGELFVKMSRSMARLLECRTMVDSRHRAQPALVSRDGEPPSRTAEAG